MNSSAIGTVLGALALAGVVVVYVQVERLADEVRPFTHGRRAGERLVLPAPVESALPPPVHVERASGESTIRDSSPDPVARAVRDEPSLAERIDRIEKRLATAPQPSVPGLRAFPSFARDVDDLSSRLKLNETQRARIEQAVRRGRQRIDDVMRIPDAEGTSPLERRKEHRRKLQEAVEKRDTRALLELGLEGRRYRSSQIPGRDATYGDEIGRIQQETRDEIESNLTPDQRDAFENVRIDPLLGEEAGGVTFLATTSEALPGGPGDGAGFVTGTEVAVELHEEGTEPSKDDE